jgi:hypothetical protein
MKKIPYLILAGSLLATVAIAQQAAMRAGRPLRPGPGHDKPVHHSRMVYVITDSQFGVVDLHSGSFVPIGPGLPQDPAEAVGGGLIPGPGTSLLTLGFAGNLEAINPRTGKTTVVGPTGLADCATPVSPCGLRSANIIAELDGDFYATDFANNLYTLNAKTGATRLIGPTGIPPLTIIPFSPNSDGTLNVYAESLFGAHGKLYATFATAMLNPETHAATTVIPGALYQINPATGHTRLIAPTSSSNLTSIVNLNDTIYAFDAAAGQVVTLDISSGKTTPVTDLDPDAGVIAGAARDRAGAEGGH